MSESRVYIRCHNIFGSKKRREIPIIAQRYGMTGFCSTGKPGFIVAEGNSSDVKEFLTQVKRWPWKDLKVRLREDGVERAFEGFLMTGAPPGEKNDILEVKRLFVDHGLENLFDTVVGYSPNRGNKS